MQHPRDSHERPPLPGHGRMEDYTVPFLWSAGVLALIALFALWATWGLPAAVIAAVAADRLILRR